MFLFIYISTTVLLKNTDTYTFVMNVGIIENGNFNLNLVMAFYRRVYN